jgi:hypothetical protein
MSIADHRRGSLLVRPLVGVRATFVRPHFATTDNEHRNEAVYLQQPREALWRTRTADRLLTTNVRRGWVDPCGIRLNQRASSPLQTPLIVEARSAESCDPSATRAGRARWSSGVKTLAQPRYGV